MHENLWKMLLRDLRLLVILGLVGSLLVVESTPFALWVHEPAFAPWGLFTGGTFYIAGLAHVIRRLFFHPISMFTFAMEALKSPAGAGLVVLGMCLVLAAFVLVLGGMLRV